MRIASKIITWLTGILLVLSTAFQSLALYATVTKSADVVSKNPWLVPVWITCIVLLLAAFILLCCLRQKDKWLYLPTVLAIVGAVCAFMVATTLRDLFQPYIASGGGTTGLDTWDLLYRHYSSVLVGALVAINAFVDMAVCRDQKRRIANKEYESQFDLSGDQLFHDADDTVDGHPMKRSLRARRQKAIAQTDSGEKD